MTACQASNRGLVKLCINQACNRVYSFSQNQDGNILVNTTAQLQHSPTHLVAAMMGCCLEPPLASQHKGSLTYPHNHLAKLEQIRGMDTGRKHFGPNEATTELNGELCFRNNRDREEAGPLTQEDKQQKTTPGPTFGLSTDRTETQQWVNLSKSANSSHATSCPSDVDQIAAALTPLLQDAKLMGESLGPTTPESTENMSGIQKDSPIVHTNQEPSQDQVAGILQDAKLMGESQGTQSLETKSQATHPVSETTTLLDTQLSTPVCVGSKLDAHVEDDEGGDMCELNARLACLRDASCSGCKFCQRPEEQQPCTAYDVNVGSPTTPEPTDNLSVIKKDSLKKIEHTSQKPFQDHDVEIQLCTPKGEKVLWEEVKWVRNPYSLVCHDSTDLLGVAPGHYQLHATPVSPASSSGQTQRPKRLDKTYHPTHSPEPGEKLEEERADQDELTHEPADEREETPPRDSSLFYSKGNPKPSYAGQQPARDLKIRRSKCQVRGGRGRGGGRFHGGPFGNLGEPSFRYGRHPSPSKTREADLKFPSPPGEPSLTYGPNPSLSNLKIGYAILKPHTLPYPKFTDNDKTETKPDHAPKFDRVKIILFSFTKYVASLKTKKWIHHGSTHGIHQHTGEDLTLPPTQQGRVEPQEHVAGLGAKTRHLTKIGAACFEPGTAFLLQNPPNHDT